MSHLALFQIVGALLRIRKGRRSSRASSPFSVLKKKRPPTDADKFLTAHIDLFNQQYYPRRNRVARDGCRLKSPVAQGPP